MTEIDYSQNDFIDINNKLFRQARDNLTKNAIPMKKLDDEDLKKETTNLQIYGSELINNLKQINYTFDQLKTYVLVPSKITKEKIDEVIERGARAKVGDIKEKTEPAEAKIDSGDVRLSDAEFDKKYNVDTSINREAGYIYTLPEINEFIRKLVIEGDKMVEASDKLIEDTPEYLQVKEYLDYLNDEYKELQRIKQKLERGIPAEGAEETKEEGAGRYYGGVGKKGMRKGVRTPPVKIPSGKKRGRPRKLALEEDAPEEEAPEEDAPEEEAPEADEPLGSLPTEEAEEADVFETIEDDDVKAVAVKNADVSRKLDKALRKVANTGQKSPVPSYITKIYELMTNLVQFIGRTTLLYLTKIKKNLNYLDEEQVKIIFSTIQKFKDNLAILETFKNKGGAIIKETLYNQVEKETLGLYNEINNSIRNYNKLTDYTTFAGAGRMHSRMVGGYYINNSPNQFVMKSTTKRFL